MKSSKKNFKKTKLQEKCGPVCKIEHNLKKTKVVQNLEKRKKYLKLTKRIVHYSAICLVPGYLTAACFYYALKLIKKLKIKKNDE